LNTQLNSKLSLVHFLGKLIFLSYKLNPHFKNLLCVTNQKNFQITETSLIFSSQVHLIVLVFYIFNPRSFVDILKI